MSWMGDGWSPAYRVVSHTGDPWWEACGDTPGVYRLIGLADPESLSPRTIARVCGTDETGTIYIGSSLKLGGRVAKLIMQHTESYRTKQHKALPRVLAQRFPPRQLAFSWCFVDKDDAARIKESTLLASYEEIFGELPPLNGSK